MNMQPRATDHSAPRRSRRRLAHALMLALVLVVAIWAVVWPADATAQDEPVPGGTILQTPADFPVRIGETVTLNGGALKVMFVQVSEDSRCPKDVLCVWSGRATVVLRVALDGEEHSDGNVTLYPGRQGQRSPDRDAVVGGYVLSLLDLQPYPDRTRTAPSEVVATIRAEAATAAPAP